MWNLRLQERDLSSYSLQMWAPTPRPVQLGAPAVHLVAMGLVRIQESAVLKPNLSCLREAWREPPPLQSHAQPRSIPPARCKSFSVVEESGALLRLPQPSNELCHNSPPPKSCRCCPWGKGIASNGSWYKGWWDYVSDEGQKNPNQSTVQVLRTLSRNTYCWAFKFFYLVFSR